MLIRRTYEVEKAQDDKAAEIARTCKVDKSQVIQLALRLGLAEVEGMEIGKFVDMAERRLRAAREESIKAPSAKRR